MLKVRSSILLTLNVTESHSAKIKIIQWTCTTWDLWNLMQVESVLTRSLSSPVYTFPFWGKVGRCLPSGCVVFCLGFYDIFFLKGIMCVANCLLWDIVEPPLTVFLAVGSLSPYTGVATGRFLPPALQGGASSCASETQRSLWQGQAHALKACSLVLLMRTELACCRIQVGRSCATGELGEGLVTVLCCWVSGSASVLDVFQPIPFTSFPDMFFLLAT